MTTAVVLAFGPAAVAATVTSMLPVSNSATVASWVSVHVTALLPLLRVVTAEAHEPTVPELPVNCTSDRATVPVF